MKIVMQDRIGAADVLALTEADLPEPGQGEVRIRTAAAGVNPVDIAVRAGALPLIGDPPFGVGWDVAGTVEAAGPGVTAFAPGDEVTGLVRFPAEARAYAEAVIAPADQLIAVPPGLSMAQAGALPLAGLTAWQALHEAGIARGKRVLVHGGTGGVGHLAVQIAAALGAEVDATAGADHADEARGFGAARAIDYAAEDFRDHGPYDVILDTRGGDHVLTSMDALAPGGTVVTLLDLPDAARARAAAEGTQARDFLVSPDADGLAALSDLVARGLLRVVVAETFPLSQAARAHTRQEAGGYVGKLVLLPG